MCVSVRGCDVRDAWCVSPLAHLSWGCPGWRCVLGGGDVALVPPGQWGAEPLHLTQVDQEGAVGAVHVVEGIARV